ncbi:MAG: BatD family protein [Opitutales bacterium]
MIQINGMSTRCIQIFLLACFPLALLAEITVTSRFDPPRIAQGDRAHYVVEIRESDSNSKPKIDPVSSIPLPDPGKLELTNGRTSTSQQTRILNGAVEHTVTQSLIFDARAPSVGEYSIPSFSFTYKGEAHRIPAATLEVLERPADAAPPQDELIFLRAQLPEQLYVGQTVRFDLELYISEQVRVRGLNRFDRSADGYTISELPDKSEERLERIQGRRFTVLSWPMTLTPIRTGSQPVSFEFGLTAQLPESGSSRGRDPFGGRSPFGGSLFDDFFGRTEQLNLYTDTAPIEVLPLPETGRPEGFSGAIGDFAIEVSSDSETTRQGEPVMLSVELKGEGNFSRIEGPSFPATDLWRIYDPEANFEADDELGLRGRKRFDYVFIPQQHGALKLPETEFSYFDPTEAEYVTLTAPPIPIEVEATAKRTAPTTSAPPAPNQPAATDLELSRNLTAEEALLTLDYQPKAPAPLGFSLLQRPGFIAANLLAALILASSCTRLHRRKKLRDDPAYRLRLESRAAAKKSTAAAREARDQSDPERFFKEATSALRHLLSARTGRPLQAASSAEIVKAMTQLGLPEKAVGNCRAFLCAADTHRFSDHSAAEFESATSQFESLLKVL